MQIGRAARVLTSNLAVRVAGGMLLAAGSPAIGQMTTIADVSRQVWSDARAGLNESAFGALSDIPESHPNPMVASLRAASDSLNHSFQQRESSRADKLETLRGELAEKLSAPETALSLSDALKTAVEIQMISADREALTDEPQIKDLVERAARQARLAEEEGNWLLSNELFYRLHILLEKDGRFKADSDRLATRLTMIRLYTPERFWELRNAHQVARGEDPLPAYNGLGESYEIKLHEIRPEMVLSALLRAANDHIEKNDKSILEEMMLGGIESLRTLVATPDLHAVFDGLDDEAALAEFNAFLDEQGGSIDRVRRGDLIKFLTGLMDVNKRTVALPEIALLHEFGNGAMSRLDEFSAVIWPDQMRRFERMTQGHFKGVGIQIQHDQEKQMIKVVTPLEGTPAQRAGIRTGDFIKGIDGNSAIGISLDQAVDLITGPANTEVTLTVQRGEDDLDFVLKRAVIPLPSVKGWRRIGAGDESWDWFIDPANGIGYVRLLQFSDDTSRDLRAAISNMQTAGLNGLILDLRFNPGGLLTQAVQVANIFIEDGPIVSTEGTVPGERRSARPNRWMMDGVPVAVLINEGAASASEIVSGAIRHYADTGDIEAILIGERTFGKGSVQNVWPLTAQQNAALKLTTQYYRLPDGSLIHRKPGAETWGVEPHLHVQMLPEQITEALTLRQESDVLPLDEQGNIDEHAEDQPDPSRLITEGIDVQLQTALVLLQTRAISEKADPQALRW